MILIPGWALTILTISSIVATVAMVIIGILALLWTGILLSDKPEVWKKLKYRRLDAEDST